VTAPRTRAEQARRIVGRLREGFHDLGDCDVTVSESVGPRIAAGAGPSVLYLTVEIEIPVPTEAAP